MAGRFRPGELGPGGIGTGPLWNLFAVRAVAGLGCAGGMGTGPQAARGR